MSRAQRSMQWCAAEPRPLQALNVGRSRICGALHAAPRPGNVFGLLRIPLTPFPSASWRIGCNSHRPFAAISGRHWHRWLYWPCTDRDRFFGAPARASPWNIWYRQRSGNRIRGDCRPSRRALNARAFGWRQIALRKSFHFIPLRLLAAFDSLYLALHSVIVSARADPACIPRTAMSAAAKNKA